MLWMEPSTLGETLLIKGICCRMASASARIKVLVLWLPVRMPFTARPPASTWTKLSPRFFICCSTRAWPALPMATTQMTAAIPMVMPSTVSRLRILLRIRAVMAEPARAAWFMRGLCFRMGTRVAGPLIDVSRLASSLTFGCANGNWNQTGSHAIVAWDRPE